MQPADPAEFETVAGGSAEGDALGCVLVSIGAAFGSLPLVLLGQSLKDPLYN